jgi:hypothetical protein
VNQNPDIFLKAKPLKQLPKRKRIYNNYSQLISKSQKNELVSKIKKIPSEFQPQKISSLSKKYNIPYNTLKYWVMNFDSKIERGMKRRKGGGRKGIIKYESELRWYNWLMDMRLHRAPVTADVFLAQVRDDFNKESDLRIPNSEFKISRGYLSRYMDRWHLSIRSSNVMTPCSLIHGTSLQRNIVRIVEMLSIAENEI